MTLEAGRAYIDLVPRLQSGFGSQVGRELESATEPVLARVSERFTNIGERLRGIGSRMTTFITLPIVGAGIAAFKFASDLHESTTKAQVVFGLMFANVSKWASDASTKLGISTQEALEASSTFGNLFRALGIGIQPATDMSEKLVGLASDLASFNNANPQDVLEALRSGIVGQVKPLRQYGVSLSEARIQQTAMFLGLWDGKGTINAAAKAQAAYAIILQDTKTAQGDFARTSDGAANKQRILVAQLKDTAAELGNRFLPIGERVLTMVTGLFKGFDGLPKPLQDVAIYVAIAAAAAGPLVYAFGSLFTIIGAILTPVGLIVAALAAVVVAAYFLWTNWEKVWQFIQDNPAIAAVIALLFPFIAELVAIVGAVKYLYENWDTIWPQIQETAKRVVAWIEANLGPVFERAMDVIDAALEYGDTIVRGFVDGAIFLWETFGTNVIDFARAAWAYVQAAVSAALDFINGILDIFIGIFTLNWSTFWDGIKETLGAIWAGIVALVNLGISTLLNIASVGLTAIGGVFSLAWGAIKSVVSGAWDGIKSIISTGVNTVFGFISSLPGRVGGLAGSMLSAAASLGTAVVNGIASGITGAANAIANIAGAVFDAFKRGWNTVARAINNFIPDQVGFDTPVGFIGVDLPDNPIPTFHAGGIVPGPPGAEVLSLLLAGERVTPVDEVRDGDGRSGDTNVFYLERERDIMDELAWQQTKRAGNV